MKSDEYSDYDEKGSGYDSTPPNVKKQVQQ